MQSIPQESENELREKLSTLETRSKQNSEMYVYCKSHGLSYKAMETCVSDILVPYTQVELVKRFAKKFTNTYRADSIIFALEYFLYSNPDIEVIDYVRCIAVEYAMPLSKYDIDVMISSAKQIIKLLEQVKELTPEGIQDIPKNWESLVKGNK